MQNEYKVDARTKSGTNSVGKEAIKTQHAKGKLTARERLEVLLDKGSFTELNADMELTSNNFDLQEKKVPGDGVITGYGRINGKPVCLFAQDFIFMGGSMGEAHNKKIASIQEHALKTGCPICTKDMYKAHKKNINRALAHPIKTTKDKITPNHDKTSKALSEI